MGSIPKRREGMLMTQGRRRIKSVLKAGVSVSEVARALGASERLFRRWLKQISRDEDRPQAAGRRPNRSGLAREQSERDRIETERDILLQASARFLKEVDGIVSRPCQPHVTDVVADQSKKEDDIAVWVRGLS